MGGKMHYRTLFVAYFMHTHAISQPIKLHRVLKNGSAQNKSQHAPSLPLHIAHWISRVAQPNLNWVSGFGFDFFSC